MQGVTTILGKISGSWAPRLQNSGNRWAKKWGPTCDRDISNSAIYTTAIYRAYTVIQLTITQVQIMAWRQIGDKPFSEPMLTWFIDAYIQHYHDTFTNLWYNGSTISRWFAKFWRKSEACIYSSQLHSFERNMGKNLPSDTHIRRHRYGSTLAQVMACCLTAPSHYLNQCWWIASEVLWHSFEGKLGNVQDISRYVFQKY